MRLTLPPRMRLVLALLVLLAASLAATASAQDAPADTLVLRPGDPTLVTDWLATGSQATAMKLVEPMQQDVGTSTDTYTVAGGRVTKVTTLSVPMQGMNQRDSVVVMAGTLAPLTHHSTGGRSTVSLEFMDEGVVGLMTPRSGEATTVMAMTDAPVFDGAWTAEIIRSLPFAEGYVAKVALFMAEASADEATEIVVAVTGQETVDDRLGWTVDADLGPFSMTYVVDAETRDLLVTRMSPQPGVAIEMVPAE